MAYVNDIPLVSVIIPNYNHGSFLEKRIQSVLNQTFQDFEIIILDDCSSDNSREIIESFSANRLVSEIRYNAENSGSTFKQWKKGMELARGKYIWIAESDDDAKPDLLRLLIQPMLDDPDVVISHCRPLIIDEQDKVIGPCLHADLLDEIKWTQDHIEAGKFQLLNYLKYRNIIPNASGVLFQKPSGFDKMIDTEMRFCGDWLFWQNLLRRPNSKIAYTQQPLNLFRYHSSTTRHLVGKINKKAELKRFTEYRSFVPLFLLNPFEGRYRWMMAEWIDRGLKDGFKKTRYSILPLLHPALIVRYYFFLLKLFFTRR